MVSDIVKGAMKVWKIEKPLGWLNQLCINLIFLRFGKIVMRPIIEIWTKK